MLTNNCLLSIAYLSMTSNRFLQKFAQMIWTILPPELKQPIYEEQQEKLHLDFATLERRVFSEVKGHIYIGGVEVHPDVRELLRDQARYIAGSQLWEIFNAAIINESAQMALIQSTDWSHIETAKMLHHWAFVFRNALHSLINK